MLSAAAFFMVREVQRYQPEGESSGWPQLVEKDRAGAPPLRER